MLLVHGSRAGCKSRDGGVTSALTCKVVDRYLFLRGRHLVWQVVPVPRSPWQNAMWNRQRTKKHTFFQLCDRILLACCPEREEDPPVLLR